MDPTLLCLLALVAADPRIDVDRAFADTPAPAISEYSSDSSFGWTTSKTTSTLDTRVIDSRDADNDVPTPLGDADFVLRGQNPTYVQPGVDPFQGQPGLVAPPGAGFQQLPAPPMTMRFYGIYENVFVTPYFSQNTAAVIVGPGVASRVLEFDWDLEYSPRAEIGMIAPDGTGWRARYWYFDHSNNSRGTVAAGTAEFIVPNALDAGLVIPAGNSASATHSLRMSVLDAEFLRKNAGGGRGLDFSFGLRYARMDQWLRARDTNGAGVLQQNLSVHHDFEGIGPTIAAEYRSPLWNSYWGVFGNARGALLYGDSNMRYDRRNAADVLVSNVTDENNGDLLGVAEMQIGLDYRRPIFCCHEFVFKIALEAQYWASGGSANGDVSATGLPSSQETDLGFFGFTVATGLTW